MHELRPYSGSPPALPELHGYPAYPGPPVDPGRVVGMLQRRWRTIAVGAASVLIAVAAITMLLPRKYESAALILVELREGGNVSALAVLDRMGRGNQVETELELIRSRPVVERVVDALNLHGTLRSGEVDVASEDVFSSFDLLPGATVGVQQLPLASIPSETDSSAVDSMAAWFTSGVRARRKDVVSTPSVQLVVEPFAEVVDAVRQRVRVKRVQRDATLLKITCSGDDPESANELCRALVASYVELRTDLQRTEATITAEFLSEQVDRFSRELEDAEGRLETYTRENQAVALEDRATEEVKILAQLTQRRNRLEAERSAVKTILDRVNAGEGSRKYRELAGFPTFLENPIVAELVTNLMDLENRRGELSLKRSASSPDVVAIDTRVREVETQLLSVATSYEQAMAVQVSSLDKTLWSARRALGTIPEHQAMAARLKREADLLGDLYRTLESRLQEAEVAQAVNLPGVRVVGEPSIPFKPSSPRPLVNMALGLVLATAYGLGLGIVKEATDTSLRDRRDVETHTGLPVLGVVPRLKRPGPVVAVTHGEGGPVSPDGEHFGELPQPSTDPVTLIALEAFRSLTVDLVFSGKQRRAGRVRSVAITSAQRAEGKTHTACNLALVRAAHGSRTLLIDADMRASGVARFFNIPPSSAGLSDVLERGASVLSLLLPMRVKDSDLYILPAGNPTSDAAGLLDGPEFRHLLNRLEPTFDAVIVDCPPLNLITDAASVAASVDGVLLVVRGGASGRESVSLTLDRLRRAGATPMGAVLNDVVPSMGVENLYRYSDREGAV